MSAYPLTRARRLLRTALVTLALAGLAACSANGPAQKIKQAGSKTVDRLSGVGSDIKPGSVLVVPRRIYLSENATDTIIQRGYAADVRSLDKYEPWCEFIINIESIDSDEIDVTRIEPDRFVISRSSQYNGAGYNGPPLIPGERVMLANAKISSRVTELRLTSEKHPWVFSLKCTAFGADRFLSVEEIHDVIAPTARLELK